jgi:hypothetical protein
MRRDSRRVPKAVIAASTAQINRGNLRRRRSQGWCPGSGGGVELVEPVTDGGKPWRGDVEIRPLA